jgi:hypothetical protein
MFACPSVRHGRGSIRLLSTLIAVVLVGCTGSPQHVTALTVANPTDHAANVEVTGADRGGWLVLGRVSPGSERSFEEVVDFGAEWVFRFAHPEHSPEITVTRDELVGNDWRVEVPARFGDRLDELGVEPVDFIDG